MKYELCIHPNAVNFLNNINQKTKKRLISKMRTLENRPKLKRGGANIKKIRDVDPEAYRLRMGNYRAIYIVEGDTVWITEIILRSKGYRRR